MNDQRTRVGLLARAVADRALTLPLIAGMDWRDASVVPLPIRDPSADTIQGLRVAFYTEDGISTPTPATVAGVRAAAQALAQAGARVEEQAPPGIERCWDITQGVWRRHRGETTAPAYARALAHWSRLRSCMLAFMEQRDVIVCPVSACPAALHGASENYNLATIISYTVAYSLTGWPAVTVRAGTSPEGVQVVARPWREDVALAAEQCIEAALGGWQRPPL